MIKELTYNGYTANPSDYEIADGDLATAVNIVPEDGALKPVLPPAEVLELLDGDTVMYIHETSTFRHYIILDKSGGLVWMDDKAKKRVPLASLRSEIYQVKAVGNTLIVLASTGINYFLWKDETYTFLGDHIPDVEISFGLVGHPRLFSISDSSKSTFKIQFNEIPDEDIDKEFSEENKTRITEQVMAKVNKFIAQETVNKGRFCFPFLVRYALRLYDGSLTCHSAPILMNPTTINTPIVIWDKLREKHDRYKEGTLDIMLVAAGLDYSILRTDDYDMLDDWSDIIKSVDVFISKPIYTFDQEGKVANFVDTDNFDTVFIGRVENKRKLLAVQSNLYEIEEDVPFGPCEGNFIDAYLEWKYSQIYSLYFSKNRTYPSKTLHLPEFTANKIQETIEGTSTFYKLCSIPLEDVLKNIGRTDIEVPDDYLQSLVTREVMTDDYLSRDKLYAKYAFPYNNRLNLTDLEREPFRGFVAQSMFAYCTHAAFNFLHEKTTHKLTVAPGNGIGYTDVYYIDVYINENGIKYKVSSNIQSPEISSFKSPSVTITRRTGEEDEKRWTENMRRSWGTYFFYPNPNAYKMVIRNYEGMYSIDLTTHGFLNGAFAKIDYNIVRNMSMSFPQDTYSPKNIIPMPNKVYTSEVNNPFFFPLLGINTIGTGKIFGICSAAKALSEGQFGQFPLYAFTTDGVWALEVSATGSYSAKQPITRDVCINPKSITQIDTAVLFATNRGIMHISGSDVQCITDAINAPDLFSIADLPKCDGLVAVFNKRASEREQVTTEDITFLPFLDFLAGCRMIYDYTHQRIIVYNPDVRYAYIYSLKSQAWGMMLSDITGNVNSYPESLAMSRKKKTTANDDGSEEESIVPVLVDFSTSATDAATGLVITRPFKMDDPTAFKTIDTIIQRGYFRKDHVAQVLYGSNDLLHWFPVWSSADMYLRGFHGSPYKFFRLALVCSFDKSESLFGCTVQFSPRRLNQPR